jgi:uncharacterized small protein (DUF1192 family)
MADPHLRAVGDDEAVDSPEHPAELARSGTPSWVPWALATALVLSLAVLMWSRQQMGERIATLQDQVATLEAQVDSRDRVISVQRSRLDDVRSRVEALHDVLERPLPGP